MEYFKWKLTFSYWPAVSAMGMCMETPMRQWDGQTRPMVLMMRLIGYTGNLVMRRNQIVGGSWMAATSEHSATYSQMSGRRIEWILAQPRDFHQRFNAELLQVGQFSCQI